MPYYSKHWYIANYSDEDVERLNGVGCIWRSENVVSFTKRMYTTGIKKLVKSPTAHFEPALPRVVRLTEQLRAKEIREQLRAKEIRDAEQLRAKEIRDAEQLRAKQLRAKEIRDKKRNPPPGSIAEAQMTWWKAQEAAKQPAQTPRGLQNVVTEVARKAARSNAAGAPERGDV